MASGIFAFGMLLFTILFLMFIATLLAPCIINLIADSIIETRKATAKLKKVLQRSE